MGRPGPRGYQGPPGPPGRRGRDYVVYRPEGGREGGHEEGRGEHAALTGGQGHCATKSSLGEDWARDGVMV